MRNVLDKLPKRERSEAAKSLSRGVLIPDQRRSHLPPSVHPPQWYVYINEPEVARWSYNVAVEIVKYLVGLFPLGQFKGILSFSVEHIQEIP